MLSTFNRAASVAATLLLGASLLNFGCSQLKKPNSASSTTAQAPSISADPNPIKVCDGSGTGVTKLSWKSVGPEKVEVRVGRPDGDLFAQTTPTSTADTGKWVTDGMTFYLQDATKGKSLTADNTLAKVTVKITTAGCP